MKGKDTITFALLAGCAALLGCGDGDAPPPGGHNAQKKPGRTIGIVFPSASSPFFTACRKGAEAVVKAHGDVLATLDAESQPSQINVLDGFIQRRAAFILLSPADPDAAGLAVQRANAAGIPVVTFAVNANGGKTACFVASDDGLAGALCADYVGWRLGGVGEVAILSRPGVAASGQRIESFRSHAARYFPSLVLADTRPVGDSTDEATAETTKLLQAHPYVDAIFAVNDPAAVGAAQAIGTAKNATVFVVGIGGGPDAVAELKKPEGAFAMTVAQLPQEIGRAAAEAAYKMLAGEKVAHPRITIRVMPVTRDNLGQYPTWEGGMVEEIAIPWETKVASPPRED